MAKTMQNKLKLYYFYDALCGWCYGFSQVMSRVFEEQQAEMDFEIISGGMITGSRIGPASGMADYILGAIPRVEQMTGAVFGEPYKQLLREGRVILSSELPSSALSICKQTHPEKAIPFASAMQALHFHEGRDYNDPWLYREAAERVQLQSSFVEETLFTEEAKYAANQDYRLTQDFGISGFPACVLESDGKYYLVSRGYMQYSSFIEALDRAKEAAKEK